MLEEPLTAQVIGALIEVHRHLGPGLLESTYERCLCHELSLRGLNFACQVAQPVVNKATPIDCGYRIDVIVEGKVLLELKSIVEIAPIHEAQLLTYLKLSDIRIGLLVNFNVKQMIDGIKRRVM